MATDPWETSSDDIEPVRAHLRGPVCAAPPATVHSHEVTIRDEERPS